MRTPFHHETIYRESSGSNPFRVLAEKRLVICGAGALGSNLADTLVRQGFTRLRIIDFDRAETHNMGTQIYGLADVGAVKVHALRNHLFRIAKVEIDVRNKKLDAGNSRALLAGSDLVVDTFDNHGSRRIVQDTCRQNGHSCLHAGVIGGYGEVIWDERYAVPQDPEESGVDVCDYPLARNLIQMVVAIAAENIVRHFLDPRYQPSNGSITLGDFAIRVI